MNANELTALIGECLRETDDHKFFLKLESALRQQQTEIEELKKFNKAILKKGGYPYPLLTDEEIADLIANKVTDSEMIKQALRKAQKND
jgi:transcription initiation factor IIE alpha subunit